LLQPLPRARTLALTQPIAQIWKGLFYCYWHADLAPVQADLAARLGALPATLPPRPAASYRAAGLAALQREWGGLDRLRMDKFMGLARALVRAAFAAAAAAGWEAAACAAALAPLAAALVPDPSAAAAAPAGLGLHIADVAVTELVAVAAGRDEPGSSSGGKGRGGGKAAAAAGGWAAAAEPFVRAVAGTPRPELAGRLASTFFTGLAAHLAGRGAAGAAGAAAIAESARAAAAEPATRARARGLLFDAAAALDAAALEAGLRGEPPTEAELKQQRKDKAAAADAGPGTPPGPARALPPPAAAPAAAAAAVQPQQPHHRKKRPAPADAPAPPPTAAANAPAAAAPAPPGPKRVKWSLRSNVAHAVGAPVPPPAVRTPPGTRPRGPALAPKARTTRLGRDGTPAAGGHGGGGGPGKRALKAALFR